VGERETSPIPWKGTLDPLASALGKDREVGKVTRFKP